MNESPLIFSGPMVAAILAGLGDLNSFGKDLNARHFWQSAGVTWSLEAELWKEANRA